MTIRYAVTARYRSTGHACPIHDSRTFATRAEAQTECDVYRARDWYDNVAYSVSEVDAL